MAEVWAIPGARLLQWDPTSAIRDATGNYITNSKYASIQWNPVAQALSQSSDGSGTNISGTGNFHLPDPERPYLHLYRCLFDREFI